MKIAVIGGGASGLVAAYLLDRQGHQVTVFERQNILGGHIRTLNKNIQPNVQPCGEYLEAGVLEFPVEFIQFLHLMQDLGVELEPVPVGSGLFYQDGRHFLSPVSIEKNFSGWRKWQEVLQIDGLYARSVGLWLKTHLASLAELQNQPLSKFLGVECPRTTWVKLLTMYSYSMAYGLMNPFPAELAIPALRRYVFTNWVRIQGGVYSYIEKILDRFQGEIILNAQVRSVFRHPQAVEVLLAEGTSHWFDKLVLATPPDQVLKLLADAHSDEVRRFEHWQANEAETIIHTEMTMYEKYGIKQGSEFDFFQTGQDDWGYNAALNQLCGTSHDRQYSLAFNLKQHLNPEHIIHRQKHQTPLYTVEAFRNRNDIIARNGEYNTYYAGAYLGDGLHEGAIASAVRVAEEIG